MKLNPNNINSEKDVINHLKYWAPLEGSDDHIIIIFYNFYHGRLKFISF